jgi:hypothetical protein
MDRMVVIFIECCQPGSRWLPWKTVPTNSSTLKALHPFRHPIATTPSELFSFSFVTQRSRSFVAPTLG